MKRPSFQFYPADWRKDAALQSCSLAAQGLWANLLCIAHECEPYGHLTVNSRPMLCTQVARLVGLSAKECDKLLSELHAAGVNSISAEGAIYSRRMVCDEDIRNRRANGGSAGAEHGIKGAEHGLKGGRPTIGRGVIYPPIEPPPSSSSSSSSSKDINTAPGKRVKVTVHGFPPGFDEFWSAYPRKIAKPLASKAFAKVHPDAELLARILASVRQQASSEQWCNEGGRFVPHAATWLNGQRWLDEVSGETAVSNLFANVR